MEKVIATLDGFQETNEKRFLLPSYLLVCRQRTTLEQRKRFVWNLVAYTLFTSSTLRITLTISIRSEDNIFIVHAMKEYRGSRGITPLILDIGTRWRWVVNFTFLPIYSLGKKKSLIPYEYEAGYAKEEFWSFWRRKTLLPVPRIKPRFVQRVT